MDNLNKSLLYKIVLLFMVLLLSFIFSIFIYNHHENILLDKLSTVLGVITENSKELEILAMNQLKSDSNQYTHVGKETLGKYGYNDGKFIFIKDKRKTIISSLIFSFCITILCFIVIEILDRNKKKEEIRIN